MSLTTVLPEEIQAIFAGRRGVTESLALRLILVMETPSLLLVLFKEVTERIVSSLMSFNFRRIVRRSTGYAILCVCRKCEKGKESYEC